MNGNDLGLLSSNLRDYNKLASGGWGEGIGALLRATPSTPIGRLRGSLAEETWMSGAAETPALSTPVGGTSGAGGDIRRGIYSLLFFFPAPSGPEFFDTLEGSLNSLARIKSIELSLPILETRGLLGSVDDWTYAGKDD